MEARKANKVYQVDEQSAKAYQAQGYDIYDDGKLVEHAKGKTVPVAEYEKLKAELDALKAKAAPKEAAAKGAEQKEAEQKEAK